MIPPPPEASRPEAPPPEAPPPQAHASGDCLDRLHCPCCGCPRLPVAYTRHVGDAIQRVRACHRCGRRLVTRERLVGVAEVAAVA